MKKFLIILAVLFFPGFAGAALSSSVVTGACLAGQTTVFKMSAISNAHAGLASSSYLVSVCVSGVSGLSNSCSGTFATVLKLSGSTNAHARQGDQSDYPSVTNACLSAPAGGSVSVGYQVNNCSGFDTTFVSMSQFPTNAHVGDSNAYLNKICASASEPPSGVVLIPSSSPVLPPMEEPVEQIISSEVLLPEETFNITAPLEQVSLEQVSLATGASSTSSEVFDITPPTAETGSFPEEENSVLPNPASALPGELAAVSGAEIPQIEPTIKTPSNRGLLATAFVALDFPPKDISDWLFWVAILILGILALRSIFYIVIHKIRK